MQCYRKLRVEAKAHSLATQTRRITYSFPRNRFGSLSGQMVRAAESVLFNIVEGCGANSSKEFARYLEISCKSTMELECQLALARDYGIIATETFSELNDLVIRIRRMLWSLRRKVLAKTAEHPPTQNR